MAPSASARRAGCRNSLRSIVQELAALRAASLIELLEKSVSATERSSFCPVGSPLYLDLCSVHRIGGSLNCDQGVIERSEVQTICIHQHPIHSED